jgi:hypothetical protein
MDLLVAVGAWGLAMWLVHRLLRPRSGSRPPGR